MCRSQSQIPQGYSAPVQDPVSIPSLQSQPVPWPPGGNLSQIPLQGSQQIQLPVLGYDKTPDSSPTNAATGLQTTSVALGIAPPCGTGQYPALPQLGISLYKLHFNQMAQTPQRVLPTPNQILCPFHIP